MKKFFLSLSITLCLINLNAQNIRDTTILAPVISASYAVQLPLLDMAKTFGVNSNIGVNGGVKLANNWQIELEGTFLFSKNIKIGTLLDPIVTSDRQIIANDGGPANIEVYERGITGCVNLGRVFPVIGPNPNSGLIAKFGLGFIRHKIRIENQEYLVPQLDDENVIYFDRLTLGVMTKQYFGYQHLGNNNLTNFHVGIEFIQGFTKGMRDYQIDLEGPYNEHRLDFMIGLRVGWIFPVYRKAPAC
ncbi:hypothetical protein [Parvicella tangerina]|nr:hypothetical protein [Parvicella tangerina]